MMSAAAAAAEAAMTPSDHAEAFAAMLQDRQRMSAYRDALDAAVTPDSVVADVGTDLGVLALLAARAGARKVYAVERVAGAARLAQAVFAANGRAKPPTARIRGAIGGDRLAAAGAAGTTMRRIRTVTTSGQADKRTRGLRSDAT